MGGVGWMSVKGEGQWYVYSQLTQNFGTMEAKPLHKKGLEETDLGLILYFQIVSYDVTSSFHLSGELVR